MKVLLINDLLWEKGGAEKVVFDIKKLLIKKNYQVELIGSMSKSSPFNFFSKFFSLKYFFKTIKTIKFFDPDVVHVHNFSKRVSPSVFLASKLMKKRVILTVHDFHLYCPNTYGILSNNAVCLRGFNMFCPFLNCLSEQRGLKFLPYNFLKWMKVGFHRLFVHHFVDDFLFPSTCLKKYFTKSLAVDERKVHYLPNFIDIKKYSQNTMKPSSNYFIYVGRISEEKGIIYAIQSFELLINEGMTNFTFDIIGDGPDLQKLQHFVQEKNLEKNIHFLGRIDNAQLSPYYKKATAVILPSICLENNPLVALESMGSKTPLIGSNVGGIPDLIEHNTTGFLCKAGNPKDMLSYIKKLVGNDTLSVKMGEAAFLKLKKTFTEEECFQKLLLIYESSIS